MGQNRKKHRVLTLPNIQANLDAIEQLKEISFGGRIATTSRYPDERKKLLRSGATAVFNIHTEAGAGFTNHVELMSQSS